MDLYHNQLRKLNNKIQNVSFRSAALKQILDTIADLTLKHNSEKFMDAVLKFAEVSVIERTMLQKELDRLKAEQVKEALEKKERSSSEQNGS